MGRAKKAVGKDLGTIQSGPSPRDVAKSSFVPGAPLTEETMDEGPGWRRAGGSLATAEDLASGILWNVRHADGPIFDGIRRAVAFELDHLNTTALALENKTPKVTHPTIVTVGETETTSDLSKEMQGFNQDGYGLSQFSQSSREKLVEQCNYLYYRDPFVRNIVRAYTFLTVGRGMGIIFPSTRAGRKASERWEVISRLNDWGRRYRETIMMTYDVGEWFLIRYPLLGRQMVDVEMGTVDRDKVISKLMAMSPEKVRIRTLEPLEIDALVASPKDREAIMAYTTSWSFRNSLGPTAPKEFWASDITAFQNDAIGILARGRTILEPVLRDLSHRRLFMLDRLTLNAIRTRIPMIWKTPGGPKGRGNRRDVLETRGLPRAGTLLVCGAGDEVQYPELNLGGAEAQHDYRALVLSIAAGVSLPEWLLTSDSSNSNYSSTLVAASPLRPLIDEKRMLFATRFADMIEEVVGVRPMIRWQELVIEDPLKAAQANSILRRDRVISRATYATRCGIEWEGEDGERAKLDEEEKDDPPVNPAAGLPPVPAPGVDDDEGTDGHQPKKPTGPTAPLDDAKAEPPTRQGEPSRKR